MTDPLKGKKIDLDGKVRTVKFNMQALRVAQRRFGGTPIRNIIRSMDVDQVCEMAAAGFLHEDKTSNADRVSGMLDREPHKFNELATAIIEAIGEAYARMSPPKANKEATDKPAGEEKAPSEATTSMLLEVMEAADGQTGP